MYSEKSISTVKPYVHNSPLELGKENNKNSEDNKYSETTCVSLALETVPREQAGL